MNSEIRNQKSGDPASHRSLQGSRFRGSGLSMHAQRTKQRRGWSATASRDSGRVRSGSQVVQAEPVSTSLRFAKVVDVDLATEGDYRPTCRGSHGG
ncbi:hypothetical protein T484DRAFT_3174077 [Baffinella frigidus]|nr:hypothetical protein T484DRAFT_3174077 [Cryptophyta sp. CCMP2293]